MEAHEVHEKTFIDGNGIAIRWHFEVVGDMGEVPIIDLTGELLESGGGTLHAFIPVPVLQWVAAHFEGP